MSSAAVQQQQATPQQYYKQDYPSQSDRYGQTPPSSRRPTTSNNTGNASIPNTPQQNSYTSPTSAMTSPRSHASPSEPMSQSTYQQFYPDSATPTSASALPIRTSSQQAPPTSATASPYDSRGYSSRSQQQASSGYGSESERQRAAQRQSNADSGSASRSSQRSRPAPTQSRSSTAVGQLPVDASLPRENSAIINRIVVDDPQADIARERARVAEATPHLSGTEPPMMDAAITAPVEQRRSRQEHLRQPAHRKEVKFGDYILGQTLGEGEFGKVKMGWKKDSTVQVAIKLIRKESLQSNATRLPKIYREISILRDLQHPNIVRLHEFVETERHMGIILEYASGGELFDYILNHRYLKDPAARRLFAQLVSGVGYLHKKGIVHRDLKLENLLLDRNKNIIITDFGFANTFNPNDELPEEVERKIQDKSFVKERGLDVPDSKGMRRGDLMQTSCGSPCYAAPELVVSDGLYTGRKVDVWSCGVILYAMLAGYLPFDDDPANPEGDNINLLYKYIVSTPLTFPEYVTPHARDLLRRILVPDPSKRADLFEVARHSWLSEYSHVVGFIGSSTKSDRDIATSALQQSQDPILGRSASVRDSTGRSPASAGGIAQKQPPGSADAEAAARNTQRDNKRRTVQLEYVPPKDMSARGEASPSSSAAPTPVVPTGRTRVRGDSQGPVEVPQTSARDMAPQVPRKDVPATSTQNMAPPARPAQSRTTSDNPASYGNAVGTSISRPTTGGTIGSARLPSRGNSYSQPAMPAPTNAFAQGHLSQPKSTSSYMMSSPMQQSEQMQGGSRPVSSQNLAQYQYQPQQQLQQDQQQRGHKRSSTLGSIGDRILGRSSSRRASQQQHDSPSQQNVLEKKNRKYPPVSMRNAIPNNPDDPNTRSSMESSRRPSFGFSRKNSETTSTDEKRTSRRFSFLPSSFSMNNFSKKDSQYDYDRSSRPASKGQPAAFGQGKSRSPSMSTTNSTIPLYYEADREAARAQRRSNAQPMQSRYATEKPLPAQPAASVGSSGLGPEPVVKRKQYRDDGYGGNLLDASRASPGPNQMSGGLGPQQDPVERFYTPNENLEQTGSYSNQNPSQGQDGYVSRLDPGPMANVDTDTGAGGSEYPPTSRGNAFAANAYSRTEALPPQQRATSGVRPANRKFEYDQGGHGGSSSATRRVMDFFRRRGREREG